MQHAEQLAAKLENKEYGEGQRREVARPDLRQKDQPRDGSARPSIRPRDADAPRADGAPKSAPGREGITP
jgi:hypothetical protein